MIQAGQLPAPPACGVLCSFSKYLLCQALGGDRKKVPGAQGRETSDKIKHTKGLSPLDTLSPLYFFSICGGENIKEAVGTQLKLNGIQAFKPIILAGLHPGQNKETPGDGERNSCCWENQKPFRYKTKPMSL